MQILKNTVFFLTVLSLIPPAFAKNWPMLFHYENIEDTASGKIRSRVFIRKDILFSELEYNSGLGPSGDVEVLSMKIAGLPTILSDRAFMPVQLTYYRGRAHNEIFCTIEVTNRTGARYFSQLEITDCVGKDGDESLFGFNNGRIFSMSYDVPSGFVADPSTAEFTQETCVNTNSENRCTDWKLVTRVVF